MECKDFNSKILKRKAQSKLGRSKAFFFKLVEKIFIIPATEHDYL